MSNFIKCKVRSFAKLCCYFVFLLGVLLLILSSSTCLATSIISKDQILSELGFQRTPQDQKHLRILSVYHTSFGTINRTKSNLFQAKLKNSNEDVRYFSDLPAHQINQLNAYDFFKLYHKGICSTLKNNGVIIYQVDHQLSRVKLPVSIQKIQWISKSKNYFVVNFNILSNTETINLGKINDVVLLIYQHCY